MKKKDTAKSGISELVLYHAEDGKFQIALTRDSDSIWMNLNHIADLYQTSVPSITIHKRNIMSEDELDPVSTVKNYLTVRSGLPIWYTNKPSKYTTKSHVNYVVLDSTWESSEAFHLDHNPEIDAWVKNDHLSFEILYIYKGVVKKYRPDFIIRKKSGEMCILETKGQETEQDRVKKRFLQEWINAVNHHGGFGKWAIWNSLF